MNKQNEGRCVDGPWHGRTFASEATVKPVYGVPPDLGKSTVTPVQAGLYRFKHNKWIWYPAPQPVDTSLPGIMRRLQAKRGKQGLQNKHRFRRERQRRREQMYAGQPYVGDDD